MRDFLKQAPESPGDQLILTSDRGTVEIPDGAMLFGAEFERDGRDLLLHNDGAPDIRIIDYFRTAQPADLQSPEGGILRGAVVERLAGPEAPGQYAQAGNPAGADPIGQVESVDGIASVQRTDGTTEPLNPETKIFLGDVVQTGPAGNLSITFADGTIFTLSPASRMVIDELIYSASGQNNSATFNLVQGGFVFIAGQIAHTGGMDVTTPAATMGIRGTTVLVDVQTQNGISTVEVTLTRDPGGSLGRFELFDNAGSLIATVSGTNNKWVVSTEDGETREVARTSDDERADNVLIAEATAAYETAFQRFNQSGSFVELDNIRRGTGQAPDVQNLDGSDSDGIDLDNQDDAPPPELAPAPTPELPTEEDLEREGRNELHEPERNIRVTGLEDSEDAPIAGLLPTGGGSNIFALVDLPGNGTVNLGADGSYIYVPDPNFFGSDEFTYTVTTPGGEVEDGEVLVTILPVNDVPIIDNQKVKVTEDGAITGQATATDFDDDTLSYRLLTGAASGSVVVTRDGVWVYTPDPDYAGADRFSIEVSDPDGATATQVVRVSVTGTNDTPVVTSGNADAKGAVTQNTSPSASGKLSASDADAGAVLSWTGSAAGIYGSFTIGTDGAWSYSLGPVAEALTAGESVTERFTATVSDDQGATATETVAIRITGTNDTPVVTSSNAEAKGSVTETTSPSASGQLTATDADAGAVLSWTGSAAGTYGSFTIGADGAWSYSLDTAAEALTAGESVTERFTATVTDDQGATATETVVIRTTGTNDLPVVTSSNAEAKGSVTETTSPSASGQLSASDADAGAVLAWTGSAAGIYGSFTIGTDGAWSYSLGPIAEALTAGESVTERFTATVSDDQGATATETVAIRITGTNDLPVVTSSNAEAKGAVTETTSPTTSGQLTATDADAGAVLSWTGSAGGTYGSFTIGTDGAWSYSLGPVAEALTAGESVTERFTATVTDDQGATAAETVVIRITGTNDLPVVTSGNADAKGSVTQNTSPTTSGQLSASDADAGAVLSWTGSAAGIYGSFTIGTDGAWSYSLGTTAEALTAGESVTERFTATVTDDQGATATETVVIRITGTNDLPVVTSSNAEAKGAVTETTSPTTSGQLTATDADAGAVLAWTGSADGTYGSFTIGTDGAWSYSLGAAADALTVGESVTERFTATVTDDQGATATETVVIRITGSNDAPVVTSSNAEAKGSVTETTLPSASGKLSASDADAGAVLSWTGSAAGTYGSFIIGTDGAWSYSLGTAAEALTAGESMTERFTATVTDDQGATATETVVIRITGTNDLPVVTSGNPDAKGSVTETTSPTTSGQLTATDADAGAVLAWTGSADGTYGSFTIGTDGAWSYSLGPIAEALTAGESVTERFTATVTDDQGTTATETVVIRITGTNDAPVITTTQTDLETIQGASVSGQLTAVDLDAGTVLAFALGSDEPEHGAVQIAANGSWTYTPDAGFAGIDSFGHSVTDDQGATATSSITVAVNSAPHPTTSGQIVTLNIEPTPGGLPAGSVIASASPISGPEVNLVVALDRSGSIGSAQWQTEINAVADALDVLKAQFAGSATHVEVQVITYADTARVEGTFDLDDPALGSTLRTLPYSGGTTNWTQTIYLTEAFFDRQPAGETNFLYFISDGSPSSGSWQPVFDRMTNEDAKGYSVNVEAFGIGGSIDLATLSILDATPQLLSGPADLVDGFTETPLFSARLVDLSVTLIADGTDMGEIADETAETLVISGFDATLSLADIDGLASLLGSQNRISVTGGFDLDGDSSTVELTLFASERFGVAEATQTIVGTDGSDLLFGSDEADTLTGNGGNDVILAFDGDDTLTLGAGADTVMAGAGDDFITITSFDGLTGGRVESIDGGDGRDTLKITAPVDVEPDYLSLVDLSGIEVLDIANGHADDLDLTIGDLLDLSGSDDDLLAGLLGAAPGQSLTVLGEAGDSLTLTEAPNGQFVDTGTQVEGMDGTTLNVFQYTSGSDVLHTLAVDADVTVNVQTAAA